MKELNKLNLTDKKYIIFDMDGTLIDSIGVWNLTDKKLIEEIADEIDAKTCREVLRTLNLTEDEKLKFEQILYSKIKDENRFAENFFYLFQKDSYNLSNKFKGGYVGIKRYMQTSSKFKGVVVPKEISEELDRLAIVQTTTEAVITDVMIEQHLFGDRNPDLLLPFSYEKVEVNNSQK